MQERLDLLEDALVPIWQLPVEVFCLIVHHFTPKTWFCFILSCRFFSTLPDEPYWRERCKEYSPLAVEEINKRHQPLTWKGTYRQLQKATQNASQRLEQYYTDAAEEMRFRCINDRGIDPRFIDALEMLVKEDAIYKFKFERIVLLFYLHVWDYEPFFRTLDKKTFDAQIETQAKQLARIYVDEKYQVTVHHCKLFSAAATGNTALALALIQEQAPVLDDIYNPEFMRYIKVSHKHHPLSFFPIRYALIPEPTVEEPCLVSFARFYDQPILLDYYYETAKQTVPQNQWLHWAVICKQSAKTIEALLESGIDVNEEISYHGRFKNIYPRFTPLHLAVLFEDLEIVTLLIERGSHVGKLPLDSLWLLMQIPIKQKQDKIVTKLMAHGGELLDVDDEQLILQIMSGDVQNIGHDRSDLWNIAWIIAWLHDYPDMVMAILSLFPDMKSNLFNDTNFQLAALHQSTGIVDITMDYALKKPNKHRWLLPQLITQALLFNNFSLLIKGLDKGIDMTLFNEEEIRSWIEDASLKSNARIRAEVKSLLLCEFRIQEALSSPNWYSYLNCFFGDYQSALLKKAAMLNSNYFAHRAGWLLDKEPKKLNNVAKQFLINYLEEKDLEEIELSSHAI